MATEFEVFEKDGVMLSASPFEASNFDVRGRFEIGHSGSTESNTVAFGLVGLTKTVNGVANNYLLLRVKRGSSGNVTLEKMRGGVPTVLDTASYPIAVNTKYWARLVYLGGHVHAYIGTSTDWGDPLIDYLWADTGDYPCPSSNSKEGHGKVGIYARIDPLKFTAASLDQHSTAIPVLSLGQFGSFPAAGVVDIQTEKISYTRKSGTAMPGMNTETASESGEQNNISAAYVYNGAHTVRVMTTDDSPSDYSGYALWFESGRQVGAAWEIASCAGGGDPTMYDLSCLDSGHADTNHITPGNPVQHEFDIQTIGQVYVATSSAVTRILPCLAGGSRSGSASGHVSDTCYLDEQDKIICHDFEAYDFYYDNCTEDLLRKECWLPGVETEFVSMASGSAALTATSGSWGTPVYIENNDNPNVDITADYQLDDGEMVAVGLRFDNNTFPVSSNGFLAGISRSGGDYYAVLYDADLSLMTRHKYTQAPVGTFTMRVVSCIKVTGDEGTYIAIYLNGMVYTFYASKYKLRDVPYYTFLAAYGGNVNITYRIPEFSDWREGVYVDTNVDAQSALGEVITQRFVKFVSRSGEKLKFSAFDNHGNPVAAYSGRIIDDQFSQEDSEVFSYMFVSAESRQEILNADLIAEEGFLVKTFHAPRLTDYSARSTVKRHLRASQEAIDQRTISIPADPRLENEDKITVGYTTAGSTLVLSNQDEIVNDLTFSLGPAQLDLRVGVRRHVDDEIL